jgi:hypothetical protein
VRQGGATRNQVVAKPAKLPNVPGMIDATLRQSVITVGEGCFVMAERNAFSPWPYRLRWRAGSDTSRGRGWRPPASGGCRHS